MFEIRHCHYYSVNTYAKFSDPFTLLFSHVVESWKSKNTRNLWLRTPEPLPETGVLANQKPRNLLHTHRHIDRQGRGQNGLYSEVALAKKCCGSGNLLKCEAASHLTNCEAVTQLWGYLNSCVASTPPMRLPHCLTSYDAASPIVTYMVSYLRATSLIVRLPHKCKASSYVRQPHLFLGCFRPPKVTSSVVRLHHSCEAAPPVVKLF